jgi:hypothetical protein
LRWKSFGINLYITLLVYHIFVTKTPPNNEHIILLVNQYTNWISMNHATIFTEELEKGHSSILFLDRSSRRNLGGICPWKYPEIQTAISTIANCNSVVKSTLWIDLDDQNHCLNNTNIRFQQSQGHLVPGNMAKKWTIWVSIMKCQ